MKRSGMMEDIDMDSSSLMELGIRPNKLNSPKKFDTNGELCDVFGSIKIGQAQNEDDDDDDVDIDQLNIDEVDQVRGDSLDNNLAVDEDFQHSLNERANQFTSGSEGNSINTSSFPSIPRPKVDYQYNDEFDFKQEIDGWFTANELNKLPKFKNVFENVTNISDFNSLREEEKSNITKIFIEQLGAPDQMMNSLYCLLYVSLGAYGFHTNVDQHVEAVKTNNLLLSENEIIPKLIDTIESSFHNSKDMRECTSYYSILLFLSTSISYFIIATLIEERDFKFTEEIDQQGLLITLLKLIDTWRWNSMPCLRIRNIIALFSKTFRLLIGGFEKRDNTKNYLCEKFGIVKEEDPMKLTATPLDYYVFREDILARYPTSIPPPSTLPENFENSSSLSQFINIPRTLVTSKANASLPVPSVHISTPAPSPPSTPVNKTSKVKRSYQTNQSYPFIYPIGLDGSESSELLIPKSIEEASELCASRVQEKLSLKQFWSERDNFMKQERGWVDAMNLTGQEFDDYSRIDDNKTEITSLLRIEQFYSNSLPYFSSLVHVLLQIIISSQENNQILEGEDNDLHMMLETIRAKELALKDATYILVSLLKWMKISHILKFEYLCTLVYDSNYYAILVQYLKSVGESVYSRIRNTVIMESSKTFWSQCSSISITPYNVAKGIPNIDHTFCFNLTSLLTIGAITCHKKTQRILALSEKDPAKLFKPFFVLINNSLWKPILKMTREITPFNGRKWKSYNMDLISMVYLHMKPQLRENWLSGRDLDGELKDAYGQEIALRAIIQFYNLRRYREVMHQLGYEKREGDFFTREMELFAVSDV